MTVVFPGGFMSMQLFTIYKLIHTTVDFSTHEKPKFGGKGIKLSPTGVSS